MQFDVLLDILRPCHDIHISCIVFFLRPTHNYIYGTSCLTQPWVMFHHFITSQNLGQRNPSNWHPACWQWHGPAAVAVKSQQPIIVNRANREDPATPLIRWHALGRRRRSLDRCKPWKISQVCAISVTAQNDWTNKHFTHRNFNIPTSSLGPNP